jgi:hypothetical protein
MTASGVFLFHVSGPLTEFGTKKVPGRAAKSFWQVTFAAEAAFKGAVAYLVLHGNGNTMTRLNFDDTGNTLLDFDIALAVSQKGINGQLQAAWDLWNRRDRSFSTLEVLPEDRSYSPLTNRQGDTEPYACVQEAVLGAPLVSISDVSRSDVVVRLPLTSGTCSIRTLEKATGLHQADTVHESTTTFKNWVLRFTAKISKRETSIDELEQLSGKLGAERARELIDHAKLGVGTFSIACLFLDISNAQEACQVNFEIYPDGSIRDLPLGLGTRMCPEEATAVLKALQRAKKPFILGAAVYPRDLKRTAPSLALKDFRLNTSYCPEHPGSSTLNYLGVFHGDTNLPDATTLDRVTQWRWLNPALVSGQQEAVSGVMVIRGEKIARHVMEGLDRGIKHTLQLMRDQNEKDRVARGGTIRHPESELTYPEADLLDGVRLSFDGTTSVSASNTKDYNWTSGDVKFSLKKELFISFCALVQCDTYEVRGQISAKVERLRKVNETLGIDSKAWSTVTTGFNGQLELTTSGAGKDFKIISKLGNLEFSQPSESSGGDSNWFEKNILMVNNDWDQRMANSFASDSRKAIELMLRQAAEKINILLDDFAFIPPGDNLFAFSTPRFSQGRDLVLNVIYKAPKLERQADKY